MADSELPDGLRDELREAWQRYVDLLAPLRPALHRYCRRLTGNVWDAEDLVQDALLRAFGTLGSLHQQIRSPRAYLLRIATNLWIDNLRRRGTEQKAVVDSMTGGSEEQAPGAVRDAGARLMQRLSPQERAAVVLKDVFDLSLEETAMVLGTTLGAVKAAIHRGRARLREPEGEAASRRPLPSIALVDRFVAAYTARDMQGLVALLLDGASAENLGSGVQYGRDVLEEKGGFLHAVLYGHPEWPPEFHYEAARMERRVFEGEPIVVCFTTRRGREAFEQILRLEEQDGLVARIRGYAFCPETMREVAAELGLYVRTGLYRFPTPAPGQYWSDPRGG